MIILNVPNAITLSRIIMIPLIVGIFYLPDAWLSFPAKNVTATAIFIFAAVTDWMDGYLARKLIPMLLYNDDLFTLDCNWWGTVLIIISAVLTVVSMLYYLRKALPHARVGA
jgi:phosphatidylglycerophosphate synthase